MIKLTFILLLIHINTFYSIIFIVAGIKVAFMIDWLHRKTQNPKKNDTQQGFICKAKKRNLPRCSNHIGKKKTVILITFSK